MKNQIELFTMAFTDDAVRAKLSALNESQESIVTVAQWVMFHRYTNTYFDFKETMLMSLQTPC